MVNIRFWLGVVLIVFANSAAFAQWNQQDIQGPRGSIAFGTQVVVLSSGNYFVSDPGFDPGTGPSTGAVFLIDGATDQIISQITGSRAGDLVGSGGLYEIGNDRIVVSSPEWNRAAGAATWMEDRAGLRAQISSSNSIVGRAPGSHVSNWGIILLRNFNYVVVSPNWTDGTAPDMGAVTWGEASGRTVGTVDPRNSIVGSRSGDQVGNPGVRALRNGNYVVLSRFWGNRGVTLAGAATWGNGLGGTVGAVSSRNSLVGTTSGDLVGSRAITLTNGNYVVGSANFNYQGNANAGAATWCDGASGTTVGTITAQNSLVGASAGEKLGERMTALTNGHYVALTPYWDDPVTGAKDVGAVTWGKGTGGINGYITPSNSFVGINPNDRVGSGILVPLSNGNYVFASPFWYKERGAVTWGEGSGANSYGQIWDTNSLVGKVGMDHAGSGGIVPLRNGNYVVSSPDWDISNRGFILTKDVGAATWGDGSRGTTVGFIESTNSVIGASESDRVSSDGIAPLLNNGYVISSSEWNWNGAMDVGAATFVRDGTVPTAAIVSPSNSIKGTLDGDRVASGGVITSLTGNYVVSSPYWQSGGIDQDGVGAVSFGDGTNGSAFDVDARNSLVGAAHGDRIGLGLTSLSNPSISNRGFTSLLDYNVVVASPLWGSRGVDADGIGAVSWFDMRGGTTGVVGIGNSLVGNIPGDLVGFCETYTTGASPVEMLQGGQYYVYSSRWDNGGVVDAGAVTLGKAGGISGRVNRFNSILGAIPGQQQAGGVLTPYPWLSPRGHLYAGRPFENKVTYIGP